MPALAAADPTLLATVEQVLKAGEVGQRSRSRARMLVDMRALAEECVQSARTRYHLDAGAIGVGAKIGLALTIALGVMFTLVQGYEYSHILGEKLFYGPEATNSGLYGSSFFMATGFHGFHVIIGTIFLSICLIRLLNGAFTPKQHFGFEAAAWYWHFVDVVWLFLFSFLYVIFGSGWGH